MSRLRFIVPWALQTQSRHLGLRGIAPRRYTPFQNTYKPSVFFTDEAGELPLHRASDGQVFCLRAGEQGAVPNLHADDGELLIRKRSPKRRVEGFARADS